MKYKFSIKLNKNDIFLSSIYYSYYSVSGILSIIFSFVFLILLIYSLITKIFFDFSSIYKVVVVLFAFLFILIQPIVIYFKVLLKDKKMNIERNLCFYEDKFNISVNDVSEDFKYDVIYKIKMYKKMVVIFYDSINGQVIPNRYFDNNKLDFYNFIKSKIKRW